MPPLFNKIMDGLLYEVISTHELIHFVKLVLCVACLSSSLDKLELRHPT